MAPIVHERARTLVVGGGLTGLLAALRLCQAGARVTLLEAAERLGGQVHTLVEDGFLIELGAEGFATTSDVAARVCGELGLAEELMGQSTTETSLLRGDDFIPLAPGEAARTLGFQVPPEQLGKGIRTLASGMGRLVQALSGAVVNAGGVVRRSAPAGAIERSGNGFRMLLANSELDADGIVIAVPAVSAAGLLEPLVGATAARLRDARLSSSVSVLLAYRRQALGRAPVGSGFILEKAQARGLRAVSFVSERFAGRAPPDTVLLRAFFRAEPGDLEQLTDSDWCAHAVDAIAPVLRASSEPHRVWVARWPRALPVHDAEHQKRVALLDERLAGLPVRIAGSAYHGAGIDAALRSAERAAHELAAMLLGPSAAGAAHSGGLPSA